MKEVALAWLGEHSESCDSLVKAFFAFHTVSFRDHPNAHNFSNTSRQSKCFWCNRTREEVRYDSLQGECAKRPPSADVNIADVIFGEEQRFWSLIKSAESKVPKLIEKMGLSGETLAILHHTYGYDPECVGSVIEVPESLIKDYNHAMDRERALSKSAHVKEIITVNL